MANGKEVILITELVLSISEKNISMSQIVSGVSQKSQVTRANGG